MIRQHRMLSNRRGFVITVALGALFVFLAGSANALAAVTVRCVPNLSVNSSCTVAHPTIQAAVTAAAGGDVIYVGPGTYNEAVTINTSGISLLGAQAGNDAREDRYDRRKESIVDATGKGGPAIFVSASYVVIDGFTVTGGTGTGSSGTIETAPGGILVTSSYWTQILNNIFENNNTGVYLYKLSGTPSVADSAAPLPSQSVVIEHNLFRNNTAGTGGSIGYGIFANAVFNPVITDNDFTGNKTAAMVFVQGGIAIITNNTSENDGAFVYFVGTNECVFSHNHGENFGRKGVLPVVVSPTLSIYPDAAVDIGPGNTNLVISDNDLERGVAPISNGIAFSPAFAAVFGTVPTYNVNVKHNSITGFPGNGIVAMAPQAQPGAQPNVPVVPTLQGSWIVGNGVQYNGLVGIFIDAYNHNISLFDNDAEGNHVFDCKDATTSGNGTLGTQNVWFNNTGKLSSPTGLCTPSRRHDRD